ncbi:predicted protein [Thalassiosira pseudonana CCMP1335]|uniref:Uncharacterized protein n=1 Tax=Thalassiosira pseudonana TaxID=35128 RepID=B5YLY5_THAPS|nr:predicted protein [Thalassiosira pseudonana CCMP1335]ACI64313.1 predicted protein [Thalassiosira pseudonana CCMP1335]
MASGIWEVEKLTSEPSPSMHSPSSHRLITMPIDHNVYFDSKVQSLASERNGKKFSVGIISVGSYHFGTGAAERMVVISGMLTAKLDGTDEWINYPAGTSFEIPANSGFDVRAREDTAYECQYL